MPEPTRRLKDPIIDEQGHYIAHSILTSVDFTIRGAVYIGSRRVIPIIFVPGIMGTNLRIRRDVPLPASHPLNPGEQAWRPPNSDASAWFYARKWGQRTPDERQQILNPAVLEIDNEGDLDIAPCNLEHSVMRERGWGEIHTGSYGTLLYEMQSHLESTFRFDALRKRHVRRRWHEVMRELQQEPLTRWGVRDVEPMTEAELEVYADFQYPVYACGYNWLQSCRESADRLERRITEILSWWQSRKHECQRVILVTHSMGGLVARACAKRIPDKVLGMVHGAMPALGAPIAARRLACGTEASLPANGNLDNYKLGKFADLGGRRPEDTTPVLAVAAGALELLPNQLHPRPWFHVSCVRTAQSGGESGDYLQLPAETDSSPYNLYRDMDSWFRLINPEIADPARLYPLTAGGVRTKINAAIAAAEQFHLELGSYYHPATFAYYGRDKAQLSHGKLRWVAKVPAGLANVPITAGNVRAARYLAGEPDGARAVEIEGRLSLTFEVEPPDVSGDGTVGRTSGEGPAGHVRQLFALRGWPHQESFKNRDVILLTHYCIVKLVQAHPKKCAEHLAVAG